MGVATGEIQLKTQGNAHCIDITSQVEEVVSASGYTSGVVHLFVVGSTAGLTTIEFEPGCTADLAKMFERIAPRDADYAHHQRWGDHNGHSHMRASLLGPSLAIPFVGERLTLGTWQQVILVDFDDRPRDRTVVVQTVGE